MSQELGAGWPYPQILRKLPSFCTEQLHAQRVAEKSHRLGQAAVPHPIRIDLDLLLRAFDWEGRVTPRSATLEEQDKAQDLIATLKQICDEALRSGELVFFARRELPGQEAELEWSAMPALNWPHVRHRRTYVESGVGPAKIVWHDGKIKPSPFA